MMPVAAHSVERVFARMKFHYGEATFNSWLKSLRLQGVEGNQVMMTVPTRFICEWVRSHYLDDITRFWREELPEIVTVEINVRAQDQAQVCVTESHVAALDLPSRATESSTSSEREAISSDLDPRFIFDRFVTGPSNALAAAAAKNLAQSKVPLAGANPLFIHGGVGLGKTHLLHAIAWEIRRNTPHRRVAYLTAERFMFHFIRALRNRDVVPFKEQFRAVDVLLIDDIQFICGKGSTQEEFFHTFNALIDSQRQLVIAGSQPPCALDLEERMRSRLGWGLVADIGAAGYDLRLEILRAKAQKVGCVVPDEVLIFLAQKVTSNIRELEGALNKVVAYAQLTGQAVTLENTHAILQDLLRAHERVLTIEDIQKVVAGHCRIPITDMRSSRRARAVARPRQMAMYLAKKLTPCSLPEIGRRFGGKDHTTVMHAVKKVDALLVQDPAFRQDMEVLTALLSCS